VSESSHDLVEANADRVRHILGIIGAGQDGADGSAQPSDGGRVTHSDDDASAIGTWSAWNM